MPLLWDIWNLKESYRGHAENNSKHNVSAIYLISGKHYSDPSASEPEKEAEEDKGTETPQLAKHNLKEYKPLLLFPSRLKNIKCEREDEDILEIFRKVEVNLPL